MSKQSIYLLHVQEYQTLQLSMPLPPKRNKPFSSSFRPPSFRFIILSKKHLFGKCAHNTYDVRLSYIHYNKFVFSFGDTFDLLSYIFAQLFKIKDRITKILPALIRTDVVFFQPLLIITGGLFPLMRCHIQYFLEIPGKCCNIAKSTVISNLS